MRFSPPRLWAAPWTSPAPACASSWISSSTSSASTTAPCDRPTRCSQTSSFLLLNLQVKLLLPSHGSHPGFPPVGSTPAEHQPGGSGGALGSVPVAPSVGLLGASSHLHLLEDHRRHKRTSPLSGRKWLCLNILRAECKQKEKEERLCFSRRSIRSSCSRPLSYCRPASAAL